jgi:probable DNA repair protein
LQHAVRVGYAAEMQRRGMRVWRTPRVLPWNTWLRQQYLERRASAGDSATRLQALTAAQARVLWDEVVAASPHAADLLNPSSAARLAARSWRRLHDYLIPLDKLQAFDSPEAAALHAWCLAFERRCAALGAIDETRLMRWAHESSFEPSEPLALAGFDAVPPAMARLVDRWRDAGHLRSVESESKAGAAQVVAVEDVDDEIRQAALWARERVRAGATNVGVIVADLQSRRDEVRRVFEEVMAPGVRRSGAGSAQLPIVLAAPAPMASYPLVDAAMLVLQLAATDGSSTLVGRILRSPFLNGAQAESGARARADLRLREEGKDRWDWFVLERWAGITGCAQLELAARELGQMLRTMESSSTASVWAERFHQIWRTVGWPGDRTLSSAEHQTVVKLHSVVAEFGGFDAVAGRMKLARALRMLRELLADTPFEPETTNAAVTVIDPATSAGMRFDALWVTGLDADRWPAPVNPDSLIPIELQREAGIPESSPAGVLQQSTRQLARWTSSADSIVVSWARRNGDIELTRSPLLNQIASTDESPSPSLEAQPWRRTLYDARPILEALRDDRAPKLPTEAARGGTRTLELQSRCPFRAQGELRLRAYVLPRIGIGVDPIDRGAILHDVLAEIWAELKTYERLVATDDATLEARIRESGRRHVARALVPETRHRARLAELELESVARQIMRLLTLEKTRPPFAVRRAETSEPYAIGGLSITLRPDRVDELATGGELLIDYKLGDSHKPSDWLDVLPGRPRRPQLPLYGLAHEGELRGLAYVVLSPRAVEYRGWASDDNVGPGVPRYPGSTRPDLADPMDWGALLDRWRFTLTRLAERYVAGEAQVDPLPLECATCHLSTLCRVHEIARAEDESDGARDDQ